jgi:hypothetical protein
MADPAEIIAIDPGVLRSVGTELTAVGERVTGVETQLAAHPLSVSAFGLMNAWMAPPVAALVSHVAEVVQMSGALATAVGAATQAAAGDFEANETSIVDGIHDLERQLDESAGRAIAR